MQYRQIIERIYDELKDYTGHGKVADYIPALSKVNPHSFGITVATLDGEIFSAGDSGGRFTIQSISKVFTLAMVSRHLGNRLWEIVGREPSGTAFNSLIQLEQERGIPRNPFINAGALVITDRLMSLYDDPKKDVLTFVRELSGNPGLDYDKEVALSEIEHSHRNLALANFVKSFGNIHNDPQELINTYCHQCSISMNTEELAKSFLFLASGGMSRASSGACPISLICTISGLSEGLPFASNILATARGSIASAPRPYTVSVGNATISPACSSSAARLTAFSYSVLQIINSVIL